MRSSDDQKSFALLVVAIIGALSGLTAVAAGLIAVDADHRIGELVLRLCSGAAHLMTDLTALAMSLLLLSVGILLAVSVLGVARRTSHVVKSVLSDQTQTASAHLDRAMRAAGLQLGDVTLVACPQLIAFTYGLRRPSIILSTAVLSELDQSELRAVLLHEKHHRDRRDPARLLVSELAARSLYPFPLLRDLRERFAVAAEISADRAAIAEVGRRAVASAVLKFSSMPQAALAGMSSQSTSDARIRHLVDPSNEVLVPQPRRSSMLVSATSALILLAAAFILVAAPAS
jgi:beta-lactamase regulating signal transducer with metallopeptidase domain